jgi:hypothetical protein
MAILNNCSSIRESGCCFEVMCKRCKEKFRVIRNWGGGIRRADNENINPAKCNCGSMKLELY